MLELALGYSTDRNGDIIVEDTRSGMALLSRLMGTQLVDETRQRQAMFRNNGDVAATYARTAKVGRAFSAAVRALDSVEQADEAFIEPFMHRYLAAGGRQETFNRWVETWLDKAQNPEIERHLRKFVKDGTVKAASMTGLVERLGTSGVTIPE
jgi:lipopolysaccharide biosynthesis regulator YciM